MKPPNLPPRHHLNPGKIRHSNFDARYFEYALNNGHKKVRCSGMAERRGCRGKKAESNAIKIDAEFTQCPSPKCKTQCSRCGVVAVPTEVLEITLHKKKSNRHIFLNNVTFTSLMLNSEDGCGHQWGLHPEFVGLALGVKFYLYGMQEHNKSMNPHTKTIHTPKIMGHCEPSLI